MNRKEEIRQQILAIRNGLDSDYRHTESKRISALLIEELVRLKPKVLHCYLPMGSELDVSEVIHWAVQQRIRVICPKTLPHRKLENRVFSSFEEVEQGRFGTSHPIGEIHSGDIDLVLLPGVAYDSLGNRLGYGGGYYDTLLEEYQGAYKITGCFPEQLIDEIPIEQHDVVMDKIIC